MFSQLWRLEGQDQGAGRVGFWTSLPTLRMVIFSLYPLTTFRWFWMRQSQSQKETESYTAAKGGIAALTHAMAVSLSNKVRVNSISPGWIDTNYTEYTGPDATQHLTGRVGNPKDISNAVIFLCSDKASFITGENICIDGGMTKLMIYHDDHGWKYKE